MLQVGFSDDYYDWMVLVIILIDYRDDDIFYCQTIIHSKSKDSGIYYPAKKIELSANFFKNATKGPKNDPKWPKVAQI